MNWEALAIIGGGALCLGMALFFIIRFFVYIQHPEYKSTPAVAGNQLLSALLVVAILLVLVWFKESGSRTAALIFFGIALTAKIGGAILFSRSQAKNESGP